jgi:tetratricopeptide (TPR) repeat protein
MIAVVPETEPIVRAAVQGNPALLERDEGGISLRAQMQSLVYAPFKAAVQGGTAIEALAQGPFLIVLDGLDECDNKDEVQELIDGMLFFFNENPFIPIRVFITSRVEQHIQSRLDVPGVHLDNLIDHCSDDDVATFLDILFEDGCRRSPIIQAYVRQHGEWPTQDDRRKLVKHIGGSFIFASAVFKFIMGTNTEGSDSATPMDRLPMALKMNPGLDGLYAQTLARSMHLPHFSVIISTIALLETPLPTSGIAELLGIHTYEVVNVLVNLQAIIQIPGTDDIPVTLCHTSLRDFLTSQSRSGSLFANPSHHVRLFFYCLECQFKNLRRDPELFNRPIEQVPAATSYALRYSNVHSSGGQSFFRLSECNDAVRLCREALALRPGTPELISALANAVHTYANRSRSLMYLAEAISLFDKALNLPPSPHLDRPRLLHNLGSAHRNRHLRTGDMADLERAISSHREALVLRPSPPSDRAVSVTCLGNALVDRYQRTMTIADLEEAISLLREALELRQSLHQFRSQSFSSLGAALLHRYRRTGSMADLEEAISLHHEALSLQPPLDPYRLFSFQDLGFALMVRYQRTGTMTDLDEVISIHRDCLNLEPFPNPGSWKSINNLGTALLDRYRRTEAVADVEEAISRFREGLELRPTPHTDRPLALNNLSNALLQRYKSTPDLPDLEEAISLVREALELTPSPHPQRSLQLQNLVFSLQAMFTETRTLSHLQEAIAYCEELVSCFPVGHQHRAQGLRCLATLLQMDFNATGRAEGIAELKEEANRLSASSTVSMRRL